MKTKVLLTTSMLLLGLTVFAQEQNPDFIWKYQGKKKEKTIGLYGGLNYNYAEINAKSAGFLGYKAGVVFNRKFGIGFAGSALNFDYSLSELTDAGTYRLEAGYAGVFAEYIQPVGNNVRLHAFVVSAAGIATYRYDKEYAEELVWYQEIIDRDNFAVFEPGMELNIRFAPCWWVGINASYRTTSPLDLKGTGENMLEGASAGLTIKYGVF